MKRLWVLLCLLLLPVILLSQSTAPVTTYFKVAKEFKARQLVGEPIATPYIAGNPDTMQALRVYGRAIDSVGAVPATIFLIDVSLGTKQYTYTDTLRNGVQHIVPAPFINDYLGIKDSIFYFVLASTVPDGEQFEFTLQKIAEVVVKDTTLARVVVPYLDSLTIALAQTLQATTDTFYTSAVSGSYGYATLLLDKTATPGTGDIFGLGYQVKHAGATKWYGDLFGGGHLFIISDSLSMPVTDTTMAIDATHILADSVRYVFYGKSALRFIAEQVRLIWRD